MVWQEILALIIVIFVLTALLGYMFFISEREHKEKVQKDKVLMDTLTAIKEYLRKEKEKNE